MIFFDVLYLTTLVIYCYILQTLFPLFFPWLTDSGLGSVQRTRNLVREKPLLKAPKLNPLP